MNFAKMPVHGKIIYLENFRETSCDGQILCYETFGETLRMDNSLLGNFSNVYMEKFFVMALWKKSFCAVKFFAREL
jgi:hypothetical protein